LRGHAVKALTPTPRGGLEPPPPLPWPFLFNLQSCGRSIRNSQSAIRNPQFAIRNPQSAIILPFNPQFAIRNPQSRV
jgi:hypothetical protein